MTPRQRGPRHIHTTDRDLPAASQRLRRRQRIVVVLLVVGLAALWAAVTFYLWSTS